MPRASFPDMPRAHVGMFLMSLLMLPAASEATPILMDQLVPAVVDPIPYGGVRDAAEADDAVAQAWNEIRDAASEYIVASSAVATSIPEPSTVSLIVFGIAALGTRRWRQHLRA